MAEENAYHHLWNCFWLVFFSTKKKPQNTHLTLCAQCSVFQVDIALPSLHVV